MLRNWLTEWKRDLGLRCGASIRGRRRRARRTRTETRLPAQVQLLEDRLLLTLFVVSTTADEDFTPGNTADQERDDGDGLSLREAIGLANQNGTGQGQEDGDEIFFENTVFADGGTILLTGGELLITDDLKIVNQLAGDANADGVADSLLFTAFNLTIDANATATNDSRVFRIDVLSTIVDGDGFDGTAHNVRLANLFGGNANETFTLINGEAGAENGGAILVSSDAATAGINSTLAINGLTFTDNNAASGGAIATTATNNTPSTPTLSILNSVFTTNVADTAGGAIEVTTGNVSIVGGTIGGGAGGVAEANTAGSNGGGVHVTAGTLTVSDVDIAANIAGEEGGGLWNGTGNVTITNGSTIFGNQAQGNQGGDLTDIQGGGGIFNVSGTITINDDGGPVSISANSATGMAAGIGTAAGSGGGILSLGGAVTITEASLDSNDAAGNGGGIEVVTGTLTLTDVTLGGENGNTAGVNGGGLHIAGAANVTIDGGGAEPVTIIRNTAGQSGGGIWNSATGTLTIFDERIRFNTANGDGEEQGGGGIYNAGGVVLIIDSRIEGNVSTAEEFGNGGGGIFNDGLMTLIDTQIEENTANEVDGFASGGGILNSDNGFLNIVGGVIGGLNFESRGNLAAGDGGGIANLGGLVLLTDVAVIGNTAGGDGGGVYNSFEDNEGLVQVNRGRISENIAGDGGGGLWNEGILGVDGTLILRNTAQNDDGGGVWNDGTLCIINANISANVAADGDGGGVYNIFEASITNTIIASNQAGGDGGGIYNDFDLDIGGGQIIGNIAAGDGGGIFNDDGEVFVCMATIGGNRAGFDGGGVYNEEFVSICLSIIRGNSASNGGGLFNSEEMEIYGTDIESNIAAISGGGIYNSDLLEIDDTYIEGNIANGDAATNGGGGLFHAGGELTIYDSDFEDNAAAGTAGNGGGIYIVGGEVDIEDTGIGDNTANGNGGGVHIGGAATVSLDQSTVDDNDAVEGGGIWLSDTGTLNLTETTVADNDSTAGGGGIHVDFDPLDGGTGGILDIARSTISGNDTAGANGGGINFEGGTATIVNSTISGNDSESAGGGIHVGTGIGLGGMTLVNVTVEANTAGFTGTGTGDGINVALGAAVTANNSIFSHSSGGDTDDIAGTVIGDFNLVQEAEAGADLQGDNNLFETDPLLAALQFNGGPTFTHALLANSPAANAGSNALAVDPGTQDPLTSDQRGLQFPRIQRGTVDIGAFESDQQGIQLIRTDLAIFDPATNAFQGEAHDGERFPGAFTDVDVIAQFPVNETFAFITEADINNDGVSDFIGLTDEGDANGEFYVAESNNAAGGYAIASWGTATMAASEVAFFDAGDFDGDGDEDILIFTTGDAGVSQGGQWFAFLSDPGADQFTPSNPGGDNSASGNTWSISAAFVDFFLGDFNDDARIDVGGYTLGFGGANSAQVFLAFSDGTTLGAPVAAASGLPNVDLVGRIAVGDFNGDSLDDLSVFAGDGDQGPNARWLVGLNDGTGQLDSLAFSVWDDNWSAAGVWAVLEVGDFNGDGFDDVLGRSVFSGVDAEQNSLFVGLSNGTSAFSTTLWESGLRDEAQLKDVLIADFNGDGADDVLSVYLDGELYVAESLALSSTPQNAFESTLWGTEELDALDQLFASDLEELA